MVAIRESKNNARTSYMNILRKLKIKDVGPITQTAEIIFSRFCILIGPQSSGKSTIAKILSTCLWVEKEACTSLSTEVVTDGEHFRQLIEDFHRMHGYIHPDRSVIKYESPFVTISYDCGQFSISFLDFNSYGRIKVSYVPSDRNTVTMRDIEKRDLEPNNFRSFLFDWLDTNRHFDKLHKIKVLDLPVKYYYSDDKTSYRKDMLSHENGNSYEIPLYDASSGLQSLVPMIVLMHYLVTDYFDNYGKDISFEQQQRQTQLAWKVTEEITRKYIPNKASHEEIREVYKKEIKDKADNNDPVASMRIQEMKDLLYRLTIPHSISFILEEPEQNLFPQTQVELLNDIVSLCKGNHPSSVFITTHSPYLLAAANIMLFAGKLKGLGVDIQNSIENVRVSTPIFDSEFTAYNVANGTCNSLLDENTHLIKENALDSASEYNTEVFDELYKVYISKLKTNDTNIS